MKAFIAPLLCLLAGCSQSTPSDVFLPKGSYQILSSNGNQYFTDGPIYAIRNAISFYDTTGKMKVVLSGPYAIYTLKEK